METATAEGGSVQIRQLKACSIPPVIPLVGTSRQITSMFPNPKSVKVNVDIVDYTPDPMRKGQDVIVFNPGSRYLQVGFASSSYPRLMPHVIARRIVTAGEAVAPVYTNINPTGLSLSDEKRQVLAEVDEMLRERQRTFKRRPLGNPTGSVATHNKEAKARKIPEHIDPVAVEWTDVKRKQPFIVGERALGIASDEPYKLFWPVQDGQVNFATYSSEAALRSDMETIWGSAVEEYLKVTKSDFSFYSAVLIIPDNFAQMDVKLMTDVVLRDMGFRSLILHQSSVAATLGAGLSSACIVDIGAQKLSVACVEEGIALPRSRRQLPVGGDDVTILLHSLLREAYFPFTDCNLVLPCDFDTLTKMKEKLCNFDEVELGTRGFDLYVRRPKQSTLLYEMRVYDEVIKAPLGFFYPPLLLDCRLRALPNPRKQYDAEDCFGQLFLFETTKIPSQSAPKQPSGETAPPSPKKDNEKDLDGEKEKDRETSEPSLTEAPTGQSGQLEGEDQKASRETDKSQEKDDAADSESGPQPLDLMILQSINSLDTEEQRKKMLSSILLVGGPVLTQRFSDVLHDRIATKLLPTEIESLQISFGIKEMDPKFLCWKGGSILCKLESAQEAWISREEWLGIGVRAIRERALFEW